MPVFQKTFQAVRTEHAPRRGGPGVRKLRDSAGPVWGLRPPDGGDGSHGRWGTSHVGAGRDYPGRGPGTRSGSACASTLLPCPGPRVAIPARPSRTSGKLAGKESRRLCLSPSSERVLPCGHKIKWRERLNFVLGAAARCVLRVPRNSRTGETSGLVATGLRGIESRSAP